MTRTAAWLTTALLAATFGSAAAASLSAPGAEGAGATLRLSLAEAVERARASSARLAQLRALEGAAGQAARGARAGRLPTLDLSASYIRNSDVPELTLTVPGLGPRTLFPNIPDTWRARAGLALPIYTGGRVGAAIDGAARQLDAAGHDLAAVERDLVLETTSAYWSLVAGRESERVLGEALHSFEQHLEDARNRQEMGLAARNEVLAVQVERERAELSRLQARNAADVAEANLARLLDLPPAARIEPSEPAAGAALEAPPAAEALIAPALASRPELRALRSRSAAAEAAVRVARAAGLPQASLSGGYDYARPNTRILPLVDEWHGTWSLGLSVAFTAFDGGRSAAAAAQARAQADAVRAQLADAERRVRLEVTQRALELATASAAVQVAGRALEAAQENARVAGDRYREGVSSSSDLLDAETVLLRAGLERTSAATGLRVALANLERATGR